MFSFVIKTRLSSKVAVPFCIPTRNEWEFLLLHMLSTVGGVSVLNLGHCVVVFHCFNLHLSDIIWCGAFSHMLICHLCIFFVGVFVKLFNSFLKAGFLFSYGWVYEFDWLVLSPYQVVFIIYIPIQTKLQVQLHSMMNNNIIIMVTYCYSETGINRRRFPCVS